MLDSNTINIQYIPQNQIQDSLTALEQHNVQPLLLLDHTQQATVLPKLNILKYKQPLISLQSGLNSIDYHNSESYCELWTAKGHWQQGSRALKNDIDSQISFCSNDETLIGSLSMQLSADHSLQEHSQYCYEQILDFIASQDNAHLLRMWNYFPDINVDNNNIERYQQFCVGRYHAFSEKAKKSIQYPAASAVGSYSSCLSPMLLIVFIATKKTGIFLENPDQISAYHYPQQYSPKSPSFSRAAVYQSLACSQLYISGTASIVGHQSRFQNNIIGQTQQTIKNLKKLIEHTNSQDEVRSTFDLSDSQMRPPAIKVYLRNPADIMTVSPIIEELLPACGNICYLHADICRQELDIEIEMVLSRESC